MDFPTHTFPNEGITYITPSWNDLNALAFAVAKQVVADDHAIDRIVTLAKGGWPMTRSLVDFTGIEKVASIGVRFYGGVNQRLPEPEVYQNLPISVQGETVLLFDDVADTGESLIFVKKHLLDSGVKKVITASLFYKPHSKLKPDYHGAQTETWIIFPYEIRETIELLREKWAKQGIAETEITRRLEAFNFPKQWVEFYGSKK